MISTNNPFNLRPGNAPWRGEQAPRKGYCVFDTSEHGLRAGYIQLVIYEDRHNCRTVCTIVNRFAPPSDHNDTTAYIADVSRRMGVQQDDTLDLHHPTTLLSLGRAMIWHENGVQPYSDAQLEAGVNAALA